MKIPVVRSHVAVLFAATCLTVPGAVAATINVGNCASTSVQAAVNSAKDGDVIMIPAGSCTWTTTVSWTNKNIWLIGAGIGSTKISINGNGAFSVTSNSSATASYRISGMTITGTSTDNTHIVYLSSTGTSSEVYGWRLDHIKFDFASTNSAIAIWIHGINHGLIDHVTFQGGSYLGVSLYGHTDVEWSPDPNVNIEGRDSWALPTNLGTREAVYVEDSTFNMNGGYSSAVNDLWFGGRIVFRHNVVNDAFFQSHAGGHIGRDRGGLKYEIYNNTWTGKTNYRWAQIRSGTGVIFNNTVSGYKWNHVDVDDQRAATEAGCSVNVARMYKCSGGNPFDGNVEASGWPCMDQVGRGAGTPFGSQPSIPLFGWKNGSTATCAAGGSCNNSATIVVNTPCPSVSKYIKSTAHSNGQVDFVNNGDTAKPGYAPYVYPHPLQSQVAPPVGQSPPSNLRQI